MKYSAQPAGELLKDAAGNIVQIGRYQKCWEIVRNAPETLTDFDLAVLESFGGTAEADRAAKARDLALRPPAPPTPVAPSPVAPKHAEVPSLIAATRMFRKILRGEKKEDFDREKFAASVRADRARTLPVVPGLYDPVAFLVAAKQFDVDPTGLSDVDVQQLTYVDPELGERARAAKAGYSKAADSDHNDQFDRTPVSVSMLLAYAIFQKKNTQRCLNTVLCRLRETCARVDSLESRLADPTDAGASLAKAESTIKSLLDRMQALERKPDLVYYGVYKEGTAYSKGAAVTWGGSLWIAAETTTAKPGEGTTGSRTWRLAVKRGSDGKDLR